MLDKSNSHRDSFKKKKKKAKFSGSPAVSGAGGSRGTEAWQGLPQCWQHSSSRSGRWLSGELKGRKFNHRYTSDLCATFSEKGVCFQCSNALSHLTLLSQSFVQVKVHSSSGCQHELSPPQESSSSQAFCTEGAISHCLGPSSNVMNILQGGPLWARQPVQSFILYPISMFCFFHSTSYQLKLFRFTHAQYLFWEPWNFASDPLL